MLTLYKQWKVDACLFAGGKAAEMAAPGDKSAWRELENLTGNGWGDLASWWVVRQAAVVTPLAVGQGAQTGHSQLTRSPPWIFFLLSYYNYFELCARRTKSRSEIMLIDKSENIVRPK